MTKNVTSVPERNTTVVFKKRKWLFRPLQTFLIFALVMSGKTAIAEEWTAQEPGVDLIYHFSASFAIYGVLHNHVGLSMPAALFTTLAIGVAKERYMDDRVSGLDLVANGLGTGVALTLFQIRKEF